MRKNLVSLHQLVTYFDTNLSLPTIMSSNHMNSVVTNYQCRNVHFSYHCVRGLLTSPHPRKSDDVCGRPALHSSAAVRGANGRDSGRNVDVGFW